MSEKYDTECVQCCGYQDRIAELEGDLRVAHFEGYMAGVGDSEDYDHDATVMEKYAWDDYTAATEQEKE